MKPDYLSEAEAMKVQMFCADPIMKEAVRKVLLSGIYFDGILEEGKAADPLKNFILGTMSQSVVHMMTAEEKGKKLDAILNGISMVETGFKRLDEVKQVEKKEEKEVVNKAR